MARAAEPTAKPGAITFSEHIAPVLHKHCAACHRPGEIGPFSLLSYEDAQKRADFLAEITRERRMPPWKAEAGIGKFRDERRLSDDEIALFAKWAAAGAPQGDPKVAPEPPKFTDGWQLGEPDMVLKMAEPFSIPADGRDIYRCFVIPIDAPEDLMVSAVEFRPGNPKVVHHAIMFLDANQDARKLSKKDGMAGFESFSGPGVPPTGGLGAWAPGAMPRRLPDGIVKYVAKGSDLVLQLHYHPNGKAETDQSFVGLHFTKKPVQRIVSGIAIVQPNLKLRAGDAKAEVRARSEPLPSDVHLLGISPHMHNLGREIRVTVVDPSGKKSVPLIAIGDWDFNWQGTYQYVRPLRLPKGSRVQVQAVYDNSADNPKNPNNPPQEVHWGEQTNDEMCLVTLQVFTDTLDDLRKVAHMPAYELAAGIEGGAPVAATVKDDKPSEAKTAKKPKKHRVKAEHGEAEDVAAVADGAAPETAAKDAAADDEPAEAEDAEPTNAAGVLIVEKLRPFYAKLDIDKDGRLSDVELQKVPEKEREPLVKNLLRMLALKKKK
ncbi:MAG: cytochrome c [Pirellulales bacterium]